MTEDQELLRKLDWQMHQQPEGYPGRSENMVGCWTAQRVSDSINKARTRLRLIHASTLPRSRHLYDIYQLRKAGIAGRALAGKALFRSIVDHRKKFIGLKGFDYSTLCAEQISIVPPERVIKAWEEDYNQMCEFMAYGDKPSFAEIIAAVTELNAEFRIKL